MRFKTILAIETSCDETAAAIVKNGVKILSSSVATSLDIQKKYGGIVPEVAARKQVEFMIPVLKDVFKKSDLTQDDIDAIAVTIGPGLMGSLLIGVETAKTLSYIWEKPLIPTNHLVGHIYSAWLDKSEKAPDFPLIALIASGGHTDLVLMKGHGQIQKIGQTKDDAVGEAFDKVARILGLEYPGGPIIEKLAREGNPNAFDFPRPMINTPNFDFSFSGLKTAVLYKVKELKSYELRVSESDSVIASLPTAGGTIQDDKRSPRRFAPRDDTQDPNVIASHKVARQSGRLSKKLISDISASFQQAAFEVLVKKTLKAATEYNAKSILVTGGVAANQRLKEMFKQALSEHARVIASQLAAGEAIQDGKRSPRRFAPRDDTQDPNVIAKSEGVQRPHVIASHEMARQSNSQLSNSSTLQRPSLHIPPLSLATDNATYIAAAAYFNQEKYLDPNNKNQLGKLLNLQPNPNLKVEESWQ